MDLAFFVNGLPVASVELKNPNTGQNADDAIAQYRRRDPNDLFFARRALVHFAVDPDRAFVTTRLRGRGYPVPAVQRRVRRGGNSGGAGNPAPVRDDYSFLTCGRAIWQRDNWLEILQRFLHVQATTSGRRRSTRIRRRGSSPVPPVARGAGDGRATRGSTGRGRTTWSSIRPGRGSRTRSRGSRTGCRTCSATTNQPVFHKVIVITDRVVLDRQLQRTIFQFDHTPGVVKKIDVDSAQLADALGDSTSKIIISTLQMYPYVLDKITGAGLGGKRYAVIIDEAHSSQGGDAAARLKQALGANAIAGEDDETRRRT